jgi:hypothetical protein
MSTVQRWLLAIGLFIGISGTTLVFSLGGFVIAVMATDACYGLPNWPFYLLLSAPASVILSALVAAVLVIAKARWYWVIGSIGVGVVLGVVGVVGYFVSLGRLC